MGWIPGSQPASRATRLQNIDPIVFSPDEWRCTAPAGQPMCKSHAKAGKLVSLGKLAHCGMQPV
jgi:hypothetical protein